ncbi:MAG TPA: hypothetical protein VE338_05210 [Ktedonobacterales bacterium]|jgi:hypothetical protein|nr:hypothetical protein [Ktedonobacterales bacterium]
MPKTYRALATVAVVATLITVVARLTFEPGTLAGWFYVPLYSTGGAFLNLLTVLWLSTTTIAAPIVATFGAVVAAQERRWVWLCAFILLGLIGVYGASTFYLLGPYLGAAIPLLELDTYVSVILQALPAVAALIFVATSLRRAQMAGAAQPA